MEQMENPDEEEANDSQLFQLDWDRYKFKIITIAAHSNWIMHKYPIFIYGV